MHKLSCTIGAITTLAIARFTYLYIKHKLERTNMLVDQGTLGDNNMAETFEVHSTRPNPPSYNSSVQDGANNDEPSVRPVDRWGYSQPWAEADEVNSESSESAVSTETPIIETMQFPIRIYKRLYQLFDVFVHDQGFEIHAAELLNEMCKDHLRRKQGHYITMALDIFEEIRSEKPLFSYTEANKMVIYRLGFEIAKRKNLGKQLTSRLLPLVVAFCMTPTREDLYAEALIQTEVFSYGRRIRERNKYATIWDWVLGRKRPTPNGVC